MVFLVQLLLAQIKQIKKVCQLMIEEDLECQAPPWRDLRLKLDRKSLPTKPLFFGPPEGGHSSRTKENQKNFRLK
jgi:hypothetical protein